MNENNNESEKLNEELTLRKNEERFRLFIAAGHQQVYRINADWTRIEILVGTTLLANPPEPMSEWMHRHILPEDQTQLWIDIQQAINHKSGFDSEHRFIQADGTIGWRHSQVIPLLNDAGEIVEWFGAGSDITERREKEEKKRVRLEQLTAELKETRNNRMGDHRKAEETLGASEVHLRTLADAVLQLIWTNNAAGKAIYFNQRWFDYTGLTYEQSEGPGWQAVVHPEDEYASGRRWQEALKIGEMFDTEYRLRRYDNTYRWFIGRNVPLKDKDGDIKEWFGTATDIHDLKTTQQALGESEERLRVTMESATSFAIITMDIMGIITLWSKGAELIFGYSEQEISGKTCAVIFTPEDRENKVPEMEMQQAAREGRAMDERWHLRKDGNRFFLSGVMAPLLSKGTIIGYVKVARDMTQFRVLEQQKQDFIGIASHELKTPVTGIKLYAETLLEKFEEAGNAEDAELMQKLNNQVDRLTNLIKVLLDMTQITEGELPMRPEPFDINELIAERINELQVIYGQHSLVLHAAAIPPVIADRERIGQVLTNLISNAVKYSPKGGKVTITTKTSGSLVEVSIQDEGIGIPEHLKDKVFDRFFRVSNSIMQTYPGMGLGLYISAEIIRRHGGMISVESKVGKGSVFSFSLPGAGLTQSL